MATPSPTRPFLDRFSRLTNELGSLGPQWLRDQRRDALQRFESVGFPTIRDEAWRTTNLGPVTGSELGPAARTGATVDLDALPTAARLDLGGPRLFFVDGRLAPELSTTKATDEIWLGSAADAAEQVPERIEAHLQRRPADKAPSFVALNQALSEDGGVVLIADNVTVDAPIQLIFYSTAAGDAPGTTQPRNLLVVGENSRVEVVETYLGADGAVYLTNAVTEVSVADNAQLTHYRLQLEGDEAFHISDVHARQGRDSRYINHNVDLGGRLVRHELGSRLEGTGGWCQLDGLYLTLGRQHVDNQTYLDHASPHCDSREVYKGILDGDSRAVFNGRIIVRQDAQKTDAKQSNPNLLLSPGALANTRPQLEIYADDVKCTHGATIGRLDEDAVFYLRSRGVSDADARRLLISAFAGEVLDGIEIDAVKQELERRVMERLERGAAEREARS